ncbi:hypothetical protein GCK32_016961 [Trichostrongylus colubriformis]|uniref:Uncharacterized protein n=1 Tax=Trichostrongylus colubriformis TaxID=6319 RepID=A0AAN8EWS2_TRICO
MARMALEEFVEKLYKIDSWTRDVSKIHWDRMDLRLRSAWHQMSRKWLATSHSPGTSRCSREVFRQQLTTMNLWPASRVMDRMMYDTMRDLDRMDRSIYPYWRDADHTVLHVANETQQVVDDDKKFAVTLDVSQFHPEELNVHLEGPNKVGFKRFACAVNLVGYSSSHLQE